MSLHSVILCGCGRAARRIGKQSKSLFRTSTYDAMHGQKRNMQTITEVREYLKKVVGAKDSFSAGDSETSKIKFPVVNDPSELEPREMKDSLQQAVIPLSEESFREKYVNIHNKVRQGILLEDLDLLAGIIAYKHCDPSVLKTGISPLSIVTAMVDEVRIHRDQIDVTHDIIMEGHVTWSGRSSLEIGMLLTQEKQPVMGAQFVMVARDAARKKAAAVHPLRPVNEQERLLFEQGNQNKIRRLEEAKQSLLSTSPTLEEKDIVHNLFLNTLDTRSKSFRSRMLPEGSVWMNSTKLKNSIICFPEQRNIHNNIFGGFLMRKGFELAWANACVYSQSVPRCVAMDDIVFHCPVPIGSLLLMSSQVSYVEGDNFSCRVHAEVVNPKTGHCRTSNEFHFVFTCGKPTPLVIPQTYGESMLYLDGRRRLKNRLIM